jgi:hypothetical protein
VHGSLSFIVGEAVARERLAAEIGRLAIADEPASLRGFHLPMFVYDGLLRAHYAGERGVLVQRGEHTEMVWTDAQGTALETVECKRGSASRHIHGELTIRLEPWDWAFVERLPEDGIGLFERAEIPIDQVVRRAIFDLDEELRDMACEDIGGDDQRVHSLSSSSDHERFRQVQVPVWFGSLAGSGKRFIINGRTGEVVIEGYRGSELEEREMEPELGFIHRYSWLYPWIFLSFWLVALVGAIVWIFMEE